MATAREELGLAEDEAIRAVLSTRHGRHFVRMVLAHLEWNEEAFAADPIVLAGLAGRQLAAVRLYRAMDDRQPELLAQVFVEERERAELAKRREADERRRDEE